MALLLIVDDDSETRDLLAKVARFYEYEAILCAAAEEVDAVLVDRMPDLALVDIRLPDEHGVSLAWRLRKQFASLPIVVASADLEAWDRDDLRDCGINAFLPKPFDLDLLHKTIQRFLVDNRDALV